MSPMDRRRYHPDWDWISRQIRDQAGQMCEWCSAKNRQMGAHDRHGRWHAEDDVEAMNSGVGEGLFGDYPRMVRVVLTVHHQCSADGCDRRTCHDPSHLVALCQRDHLNAARPHHLAKAAVTRERKRRESITATGQREMTL